MSRYDQALACPPHASDNPDAVRGPWRAIRYTPDGYVVPIGEPPDVDIEDLAIAVVRDSQMPVRDDLGERTPSGPFHPIDMLYRHEYVEDRAEFEARWAQARLIAALLNANQEKLDALAERRVFG